MTNSYRFPWMGVQILLGGFFALFLAGCAMSSTLGQILTQVRGEPVEVTASNPIAGTLMSVEKKAESIGEGTQHRVIEQEYCPTAADSTDGSVLMAGGPGDPPVNCSSIAIDVTVQNSPAGCNVNPGISKKCLNSTSKCPHSILGPNLCKTKVNPGGNCSCTCS
jgi:hypothetical protein